MMKKLCFFKLIFILSSLLVHAQNDTIYFWKSGQLIAHHSIKEADLDSITFKRPEANLPFVTICNQIWSTRNLDVTTYSDGTPIPQVIDATQLSNANYGAWCYYNNDPALGDVYGKLYNWYAAAGIYDLASFINPELRKNLAPVGWHVPSDEEWTTLTDCLGGELIAGGKLKEDGTSHWGITNEASNSTGFTALPGGYRQNNSSSYLASGGFWWTNFEGDVVSSIYRAMFSFNNGVERSTNSKGLFFSVRCLKD